MKINVLQMLTCGIDFDQKNAPDKVSSYRRILPQVNFQFKISTSIIFKMKNLQNFENSVFVSVRPKLDELEFGHGASFPIDCGSIRHRY